MFVTAKEPVHREAANLPQTANTGDDEDTKMENKKKTDWVIKGVWVDCKVMKVGRIVVHRF